MKLQLNAGDWATIALFALGTLLGCYASEREPKARAPASTTTANPSSSARTAVAAVGLD